MAETIEGGGAGGESRMPLQRPRVIRWTAAISAASAAAAIAVVVAKWGRDRESAPTMLRTERIVAYYFHGTTRCPKCVQLETLTREAIESGFAAQLSDGRLEWRAVDYDLPENGHYRHDFRLAGPCLVVARVRADRPIEWRRLPDVWDDLGDWPKFFEYVQRQVQEFLDYLEIPGACCT